MTTLVITESATLNVRGSFETVKNGFIEKGATITESRVYKNGYSIWIDGFNTGTVFNGSTEYLSF